MKKPLAENTTESSLLNLCRIKKGVLTSEIIFSIFLINSKK